LARSLARVLSPSLPALGWEPIGAFLTLLEHAKGHMAPEDLARMIGRATIHATFARFFGANPASLPVETVMRAAPAFWGRYHTWSRLVAEVSEAHRSEIVLATTGAAVPALCAMTGSQLARVAELGGGKDVTVDQDTCLARGDSECRFVVTWG